MKRAVLLFASIALSVVLFSQRTEERRDNVPKTNQDNSGSDYKPENLGPKVNSKYEELQPYITPDGTKLFFTRSDHPENTEHPKETQDIWFCKLEDDGTWSNAKHLGMPFNTKRYNTIFSQTPDGNVRMIRGFFEDGKFVGPGFSMSYLTEKGWSDPEGVKMKNYEKMSVGKYSGACLLNDYKTMVLYFSEVEGSDKSDLYVSFLNDKGKWSQPKSLGSKINTSQYTETTPFMAADGVTLYFSSNRPGGYGSNDIYMTKRLDDTWQNWTEPKNLGNTINSNDWDAYFTITAKGDYAYMVSNKNSYGSSDIVRIKLKEDVKPNPVVLIKGKVIDKKTNQPVQGNISYITLPEGVEVGTATSSPGTGEYSIILPYGKLYAFKASSKGYYSVNENLDVRDLKEYKEIKQDLYLVPIEVGQVVRLNNIFFETAKATLMPESFNELDNVVKLMKDNPKLEIKISGHTDNVGSDDYNLKLSDDRAKSVYEYLISKGVAKERLSYKGYGETQPVADNATEEGKTMNRRVEFTIIKN